ncbi:MAG TPA: HNH endonuclease signature motif containing protein, partial [Kofleriaceae bacterium]|nr:HNH endonuclease signature motif containing protein [Kofleriaceae bacterium]
MRAIARRRAVLDAEEARWLREAERCQIWRQLGMVSALDYMERVLGYAPRTGQERLRVANALGMLPVLTEALAQGALSFSAIRELTRVATPATEAAWRDVAVGKNLRQIEELVADHKLGDRPEDPGDPQARTHVVRFELSAETFALMRQARQVLDDEHGSHLSDDEMLAALCSAVFDGAPAGEPTGRAKFQVAVTVCERCRQGWQAGAGMKVAIPPAAVERAECDAQYIGSLDGQIPDRAHQDVAPSVVRFVWRRDGGRCRVPGCRSSRGLEIHHVVHREDGGHHEPENLILACSACHSAHHRGLLQISGSAGCLHVARCAEPCADDDASLAEDPVANTGTEHAAATPERTHGASDPAPTWTEP